MEIYCWTYEAAYHCNDCATKRFGAELWDENAMLYDNFKNVVLPVFGYEIDLENLPSCDDCLCRID